MRNFYCLKNNDDDVPLFNIVLEYLRLTLYSISEIYRYVNNNAITLLTTKYENYGKSVAAIIKFNSRLVLK